MSIVPRPYPREFRDDVVRVARNRDDVVAELAGIRPRHNGHPSSPPTWGKPNQMSPIRAADPMPTLPAFPI
ncbi:hypothetical protein MAHJHV54_48770 [Mycobacterium avium subsp. hominissuis]